MRYFIGQVKVGRAAGRVKMIQNVHSYYFNQGLINRIADTFDLGISRIEDFPDDAYYDMNEKFPNDTILEDFIFNTGSAVLISYRAKTFFESQNLKNNEYLPVWINDLERKK